MSDVMDILGVQDSRPKQPATLEEIMSPKKAPKREKKKYDPSLLIGIDAIASLAPTTDIYAGLKEKRKLSATRVTPWIWHPFRNPAREDDLVLNHWIKEGEHEEYFFARYNTKITMFEYTKEEYNKYLEHPEWTKETTDELWDLCKRFDLRFPVILDRFSDGTKSMEDIKDRYYSVSKKILEFSPYLQEEKSSHPLNLFVYKKDQEVERRRQYEKLYNRSHDQVEEEKALIVEFKRIEASLKKHTSKEKKTTDKTAGKRQTKKRDAANKAAASKEEEDAEYQEDEVMTAESVENLSNLVKASKKEKSIGTFTRSSMIMGGLPVSNKVHKKMDEILVELGIGLRPLPTANITRVFNEVRHDIVMLLSLQNQIATKEYQVQLLKDRKKSMLSNDTYVMDDNSMDTDLGLDTFGGKKSTGGKDKEKKKRKKAEIE
eukprot:TRINITY_DN7680_c0_g1_i2.p1 TRINITY_DN7680_c0_g1~~TRINITY_DN7680_c0_g1_i2.p1  ORF type:complete len:432 (-),score=180.12 TRINITY_DN7680_c0_g1_i2:19-1314(-)